VTEESKESVHAVEDVATAGNIDGAIRDLEYFRDEMLRLHEEGELSDGEIVDLMGMVNTIITHITNGNKNQERLVNVMGGTIIELESERFVRVESERLIRIGKEEGLAEGKAESWI
jgi:hypothetical protein